MSLPIISSPACFTESAPEPLDSRDLQRAVECIFPDPDEIENWSLCERYLPHAQVGAGLIQEWSMIFTEAAELLHKTGSYLYIRALYAQAEPLFQQALAIREQALGLEHLSVAESLNNLAGLYKSQGDMRKQNSSISEHWRSRKKY